MFSILMVVMACVTAAVLRISGREPSWVVAFLRGGILWCVGIQGVLAAYGHAFMGPEIAATIGWPAGSPFQFQMAMANLSYGVLGLIAFWKTSFRVPVIIGSAVLYLGCAVGHIQQMRLGDFAPNNVGPMLWLSDIAVPIVLLALVFSLVRTGHAPTRRDDPFL